MTDIQVTVTVHDKIDSKIEQKITNIGRASEHTSNQLGTLNKALNKLSSNSINSFSNSITTLSRANLSTLNSQLQQLSNASASLTGSFNSQTLSSVKLQVAQTKLAQEQAKLAILQQRLQIQSSKTATAQQRQAIAVANLANAQARANTASVRTAIAQNQYEISSARLVVAQNKAKSSALANAQATQNYNGTILRLVGTLTLLAGTIRTAFSIISLADEYQRLTNKLSLVTENAGQARNRLASLSTIALNSYSSLNSTVQLYTRLDLSLRQMGGSASEAMAITGTLSKAVSLAGLTTSEASSALLQISQAFNKGKLDGDEFRTVMETMPPLADAIAKKLTQMNGGITVTRGELLKLAPEGKITAQVMKEAVLDMAETIDQKFAKLTPTISMQLQNLQTQAQLYFGAMFKDTGFANGLANAIKLIADNLEFATKVAFAFTTALAIAGVRQAWLSFVLVINNVKNAIISTTGAFATLRVVFLSTPIGWLVAGLTTVLTLTDLVFSSSTGKSIFPNFNQDRAKADDYISRLKEINAQLLQMSSIRLANTFTENQNAQQQIQKDIKLYKAQLADVGKQIEENSKRQQEYNSYLDKFNKATDSFAKSTFQTHLDVLRTQLLDQNQLFAQRDKLIEDLTASEDNYKSTLQQELLIYEQQKDRLERANKALEENKIQHNLTADEQKVHQKTIENITTRFGNLDLKIQDVISSLRQLGAEGDNLRPVLDNSITKTENTLLTETIKKYEELYQYKLKYAEATPDEQLRMKITKQITEKDGGKFGNTDQGKQALQKAIEQEVEAEKKLQERREKDLKLQQQQRAKERQSLRDINSKQKKLEQITQEYQRYVGNLEDERTLLNEGLSNYQKYNELYALKLKFQQNGFNISNEELNLLKQKIDYNVKLKELAQAIAQEENNSLARKKEEWDLRLNSIAQSNITPTEQQSSFDNALSENGITYSADQGVSQLIQQKEFYFNRLKELREADKLNETEYQNAIYALNTQTQEAIHQKRLENMHALGGASSVTASAIEAFENNATNSIMNVLNGTQSIGDAMRGLAVTILNEVVRAIVQMGVRWVAMQASQTASAVASNTAIASSATATGATITASMTPAATMSAMATYGASTTAGMTAIMAGVAMIPAILALALSGQRKNGGTVNAGDLYQVGEGNAPEIYQSKNGRQYMIAGDNGRVFSNKQVMGAGSGKVVNITQNVTINGNGNIDSDTLNQLKEQTKQIVYQVLINESREAGGMLA